MRGPNDQLYLLIEWDFALVDSLLRYSTSFGSMIKSWISSIEREVNHSLPCRLPPWRNRVNVSVSTDIAIPVVSFQRKSVDKLLQITQFSKSAHSFWDSPTQFVVYQVSGKSKIRDH